MKTLLCLLLLLVSLSPVKAAYLRLNGELLWNITKPQCQFKLVGELQNLSSYGTGPLKLVLWATKFPYPSAGQIVAETVLGEIPGSSSFKRFTLKTDADIPYINGDFYFTIAVVEYTTAGWRNQLLAPSGTEYLYNGDFADQKSWTLPKKSVTDPPKKLKADSVLRLTERATANRNKFPVGWRQKTKLTINGSKNLNYKTTYGNITAPYTYEVVKRKYKGRKKSVGYLVTSYSQNTNWSYKSRFNLFFQGSKEGTYKKVTTAYYNGRSADSTTTWGTFIYKKP